MAGKPAITKAEILDVAYARAQQDGLGGLSIRSVARVRRSRGYAVQLFSR